MTWAPPLDTINGYHLGLLLAGWALARRLWRAEKRTSERTPRGDAASATELGLTAGSGSAMLTTGPGQTTGGAFRGSHGAHDNQQSVPFAPLRALRRAAGLSRTR